MSEPGKPGGGGRRTPAPGVPVRPVPPERPEREDETPVVHITERAGRPPGGSDADSVDRLAAAIMRRLPAASAARRPAKFGGEWLRFFLGWLGAVLLAVGMWYLSVRDALRDRPTQSDVVRMMSEGMILHEQRGEHPKIETRLEKIEKQEQASREEQLHQGDQLDTITQKLGNIEKRLGR